MPSSNPVLPSDPGAGRRTRRSAPLAVLAPLLLLLLVVAGACRGATPEPQAPENQATENQAPEPQTPQSQASEPPSEAEPRWTWTDYEIVGQKEHTREEIAALLPFELGAPYTGDEAVYERCEEVLRAELDVAHVACSAVRFLSGEAYPLIEVVAHGEEDRRDFREMPDGDAPLDPELAALYDRLTGHLRAAFREGENVGENMDAGYLDYENPEMHAVVEEMRRVVPPRREELLRVLAENPEAGQRARAAWLLNWAGDQGDTLVRVIPFIHDPHGVVRNDVSRFILHHVDRVEDEETLRSLIDALAIQLSRPTHGDRNKAAYALKYVLEAHPDLAPYVREQAGPWLRRLAEQSLLSNVAGVAREVLEMAGEPPA